MKGKRKYIFTAVMLAVLLFIGNAAASFWASMKAEQDISMGTLGLELHVVGKNGEPVEVNMLPVLSPGTFQDYRISASNQASNAFYCRIRIDKYFLNGQNVKTTEPGAENLRLAIAKEAVNDWYIDGFDPGTAQTLEKTGEDGVRRTYVILPDDAENHETVIAYYRKPLNAGESTKQLMDYIYLSPDSDDDTLAGNDICISVSADAVQSVAGIKAIQAEWGLDVSTDATGRILNISD